MCIHQGSFNKALHKSMLENPYNPVITLEVSTWFRDNQGLYDYQSPTQYYLPVERLHINQSGNIYRQNNSPKIIFITQDRNTTYFELKNIFVASVLYDNVTKQYRIQSAETNGIRPYPFISQEHTVFNSNTYLAVADFCKDNNQQGYPLEVGSILRLGKINFQVIEINDEDGIKQMRETSHLDANQGVYVVSKVIVKGSCRVCLCEENTVADPLITPCLCSGSCGLIHLNCLKEWINKKVKKEANENAISYDFSRFQCQICKQLYPKSILLPNKKEVILLEYLKANKPYIILQSRTHIKSTHVLFPTQASPVKIGRGHQCTIKIDDITVSRVHAEIQFARGEFYIVDLQSKFGTLVKFKEQFLLKHKLRLQSGRSTYKFIRQRFNSPKNSSHPFRKETSRPKIQRYE